MDPEAAFEEVRQLLSQKREGDAVLKVREIAASCDDPFVRIKCLSLLKVITDSDASDSIVSALMSELPENRNTLLQIAGSLRGLGYPEEAMSIIGAMEHTDPVRRLECMCYQDMGEYESALETIGGIENRTPYDRILLSESLSSVGEHRRAIEEAKALLDSEPDDFDARRAYVSALMLGGDDKELTRFVRSCLKDKTAGSNALAAYAMRVAGKTKAAAGYASRALKMDPKNISAMETLGICLAQKEEYDKARIVAGAINETSPGNRAAINVLSYCRRSILGQPLLGRAERMAVQPQLLPEAGGEEDEGRDYLHTAYPHQDHEDHL